eukprot:493695-Prymnesium_polylepis.1
MLRRAWTVGRLHAVSHCASKRRTTGVRHPTSANPVVQASSLGSRTLGRRRRRSSTAARTRSRIAPS